MCETVRICDEVDVTTVQEDTVNETIFHWADSQAHKWNQTLKATKTIPINKKLPNKVVSLSVVIVLVVGIFLAVVVVDAGAPLIEEHFK